MSFWLNLSIGRFLPGASCGNNATQLYLGEECDDGNTDNGDGCDSDWQIESGYTCLGFPLSEWSPWPNSVVDGSETCDDGNSSDGDGCSSTCEIESGWYWDGASPSSCESCGNGII